MNQAFKDVLAFEVASGRPLPPDIAGAISASNLQLAVDLIEEEWAETKLAMLSIGISVESFEAEPTNEDLAEVADGLADLIWVCTAAAIRLGIDLPAVWEKVREANMAKFGSGAWTREDGKIMKPDGWKAPDVRGVIESQAPICETYSQVISANRKKD